MGLKGRGWSFLSDGAEQRSEMGGTSSLRGATDSDGHLSAMPVFQGERFEKTQGQASCYKGSDLEGSS